MKYSVSIIIVFLFINSCSKTTARRPINLKPSTTIYEEAIEKTKLINTTINKQITSYINNDSLTSYIQSSDGFWYTYITKIAKDSPLPAAGDEVTFTYNIQSLEGVLIYTKDELGIKNYTVDKEDFISGLQKGIKLMKEGETVTFILPAYSAYGILGDQQRIGTNQSIKSTVTLIKLNKK